MPLRFILNSSAHYLVIRMTSQKLLLFKEQTERTFGKGIADHQIVILSEGEKQRNAFRELIIPASVRQQEDLQESVRRKIPVAERQKAEEAELANLKESGLYLSHHGKTTLSIFDAVELIQDKEKDLKKNLENTIILRILTNNAKNISFVIAVAISIESVDLRQLLDHFLQFFGEVEGQNQIESVVSRTLLAVSLDEQNKEAFQDIQEVLQQIKEESRPQVHKMRIALISRLLEGKDRIFPLVKGLQGTQKEEVFTKILSQKHYGNEITVSLKQNLSISSASEEQFKRCSQQMTSQLKALQNLINFYGSNQKSKKEQRRHNFLANIKSLGLNDPPALSPKNLSQKIFRDLEQIGMEKSKLSSYKSISTVFSSVVAVIQDEENRDILRRLEMLNQFESETLELLEQLLKDPVLKQRRLDEIVSSTRSMLELPTRNVSDEQATGFKEKLEKIKVPEDRISFCIDHIKEYKSEIHLSQSVRMALGQLERYFEKADMYKELFQCYMYSLSFDLIRIKLHEAIHKDPEIKRTFLMSIYHEARSFCQYDLAASCVNEMNYKCPELSEKRKNYEEMLIEIFKERRNLVERKEEMKRPVFLVNEKSAVRRFINAPVHE